MRHYCKIAWLIILVTTLLVYCLICSSLQIKPSAHAASKDEPFKHLRLLAQVLYIIERDYVEAVDMEILVAGAVEGMLKKLDPHCNYFTPDNLKELENDGREQLIGVGIELEIRNEDVVVVAAFEGTPAARAGIRSGDLIVDIDGETIKGLSLHDVLQLIRGPAGTRVRLQLMRNPLPDPLGVDMVRERYHVVPMEASLLPNGVVHTKVRSFQRGVAKSLADHLLRLEDTQPVTGIILDLRNNPGGLLEEAVNVANLFMHKGTIVTTESRGRRPMETFIAHSGGTLPDRPLVVLIDRGSASASEIVAGALQDNKIATVVGERSFGKGSVQNLVELPPYGGLKLTVARYYTPSGRSIHKTGIVPDVLVHATKNPENGPRSSPENPSQDHCMDSEKQDHPLSCDSVLTKAWELATNRLP